MRTLASIKTISDILPIEGKDRIVLAMVDGWSVIVKKDEFHTGDNCVYTEADLYVFNLLYPSGRMDSIMAKNICEQHGMKFVPILAADYVLPDTVNEVLDYAHGQSKLYDTLREGIVFRSKDGKQSFKAVDPLFLLKHDE